jgi:hypothetical protein
MTDPRSSSLALPVVGAGALAFLVVVGAAIALRDAPSTADARPLAANALEAAPCAASATACAAPTPRDHDAGAIAAAEVGPRAPRLLEFEMPGCDACKSMAPIVRSLESKCTHGRGVVQHVDVVRPEGEALASKYGVRELPTFLAVDAEGGEVIRLSGVQRPERLAAVLTEITGDGCVVD